MVLSEGVGILIPISPTLSSYYSLRMYMPALRSMEMNLEARLARNRLKAKCAKKVSSDTPEPLPRN